MHLALRNLKKSFGSKEVLKGISLEAESGQAFGLLGRNGAGKTTTIRILLDVFPPDSGEVELDGLPLRESPVSIGYLPEEKGLYPRQGILRQMIYMGELRGLRYKEAKNASLRLLDRLEMSDCANRHLGTLSKGNQQKIQLAVALLTDPALLVLDEPFSGLDPVNARLLEDIVKEQLEMGKLVFFSSHQMNYIENFCQELAILHGGKIVLNGAIRDIKRSWPRDRIGLILKKNGHFLSPDEAETALRSFDIPFPLSREENGKDELILQMDPQMKDRFLKILSSSALSLESFRVLEPSLEDIFVAYTEEKGEPPLETAGDGEKTTAQPKEGDEIKGGQAL